MNKFFERLRPRRMAHITDQGRVFCPIQLRDVDIDRCMDCRHLADVVSDPSNGVREIVCKPSYGVFVLE